MSVTQGGHSEEPPAPPDELDADVPEDDAALFWPDEHASEHTKEHAAAEATRTARRYFMSERASRRAPVSKDYMQPPT